MAKCRNIYYLPEIKAREIKEFIIENPDIVLRTGDTKRVQMIFAEKFNRTERTIRRYIKMIFKEAMETIGTRDAISLIGRL